jgi:hypothetical protein
VSEQKKPARVVMCGSCRRPEVSCVCIGEIGDGLPDVVPVHWSTRAYWLVIGVALGVILDRVLIAIFGF